MFLINIFTVFFIVFYLYSFFIMFKYKKYTPIYISIPLTFGILCIFLFFNRVEYAAMCCSIASAILVILLSNINKNN